MTLLTDMMKKGYLEEEVFAVLVESDQERKRRRVLAIVTETVEVHRLQKMRDLLTFEKLTAWRRMNGFDRVADGEDNWCHGARSLPHTTEEYIADLWCKVNELKNAISVPAKTRPWQKTMEFVDGLKGKLLDEELAVIKRYVKQRSREAAQAQVTARPVDTVQYCSPSPQTPEPSPDVLSSWRTTRGGWTQSEASSNHHRLVRVLKRPDSSVPRTRGRGRKDEPSLTAICSLAWDRTKGETFLHPQNAWTREQVPKVRQRLQTSLSCSRATSPKTRIKAAKKTSSLTLVEKERRHRFGTRL